METRKQRDIQRMTSLVLAGTMILSLSSCKKKSGKSKEDLYSSGKVIEATDPYFNAEVHKVDIPIQASKKLQTVSVSNCIYNGECAIVSYSISYQIPEELEKRAMSSSVTGEDVGVDIEEYFDQGTGIFDKEGKLIRLVGSGSLEGNIYGVTTDPDGNIHMLYSYYPPMEDLVLDENMTMEEWEELISDYKMETRIEIFNPSGETVKLITLDTGDLDPVNWQVWESAFSLLPDGTYTFSEGGRIHVFSAEGKLIRTLSDMDRQLKGEIMQQDGKNYVLSVKKDLENGNDYQIKEINLATGELGTGIDANNLSSYGNITVTRDGVFLNSYSGCFKYNITSGEAEEIFTWNDTDVDRALMKNIQCIPKNSNEILAVGHKSYTFDYPYLIHLTRAETNPHAGKKMIVIGGEHLSDYPELLSFASNYSADPKNSARVVIVDYTEGLRDSDGLGNIEQMIYLDTISGAGPDILVNMYDSVAFRTDSIMEDMNQYLDGESGINREEYFDNIFRACETGGNLYHIPLRFNLEGLVVNRNEVQNTVGWTYEEFEEASKKVTEGVSFLEGVLYNDLLELMLGTSLPQFVDYQNKKVDLNNEDMARILEMVKKFGVTQIPEDEGDYWMMKDFGDEGSIEGDGSLTQEKFMEGMLAIELVELDSVSAIGFHKDQCPGDISYLGFPGKEKMAMAVKTTLTMGICTSSKSKGMAWDFIKAFMGYEEDSGAEFYFSPNKAVFEKESQANMQRANEFYAQYESRPNIAKYLCAPVHEDAIEEARNLIQNATISTAGDPVIFSIICEEAAAYFAGDRTVEEVLKNVQNRATTVVNEL